MGLYVFKLPDVGEGTAEAELVEWKVAVGDQVTEDQPLADVMTDKATVELTSPVAGKVVSLHGNPGDLAAVKAPLVTLEVEGAGNASAAPVEAPAKVAPAAPAKAEAPVAHVEAVAEAVTPDPDMAALGNYVFKLPDVGEGTAEAELVEWKVKVGDHVAEDQPLADVMTDKATVELTSPSAGVVTALNGRPGEMVAVGSPLVVLQVEGAGNRGKGGAAVAPSTASRSPSPASGGGTSTSSPPASGGRTVPGSTRDREGGESATPAKTEIYPDAHGVGPRKSLAPYADGIRSRVPGERPLASPAVRRRARELGVELQFVPGSGPGGRIEHGDLDAWLQGRGQGGPEARAPGADPRYVARPGVEEVKIIGLRRKIAEKMQEAKRRIPHFMYAEEVDVTELEALRAYLNATRRPDQPKLTLLPFFVRALAKVLPQHPQINARFDDDAGVLHRYDALHCGIATQTPNGLMVAVVRHAEAMDVWQAAAEIARVSGAAKAGKATKEELSGSTITVTSLGTLGGVVHTPVINHPEVAIVGPNKILERPVVRGGQVVVRKMMNLSSSFDHRIVDGYDAAEFVQKLKGLLEHPAALFMD
jgi:2-oxoisovalerate dehydrogenase E2 component (dihydrolipoyl transacylase)